MSLSDDIKKIAKTKELQEEINRLSKEITALEKDSIPGQTGSAYQLGDTGKDVGQNGNPPPVDGIIADSTTVIKEAAKAAVPNPITPTTITKTDSGIDSNNSLNIGFTKHGSVGDLSSYGISESGVSGGSNIGVHATQGSGLSELQSHLSTLAASGATQEEQDRYTRQYLVNNGYIGEGEHHAQSALDNSADMPKIATAPPMGSQTPFITVIDENERLRALVGFDADGAISEQTGEIIATMVRIDGIIPTPKQTDLDAADPPQNTWTDGSTPPIINGYEHGFYWVTNGTLAVNINFPFDYISLVPATVAQLSNAPLLSGSGYPGSRFGPNSFGNYYRFESIDEVSSTQYEVKVIQTDAGGTPIGPESTIYQINRASCAGSPPVGVCPAEPITESAWPKTGTYVVTLMKEGAKAGLFQVSQYDSEGVLKLLGDQSIVDIKCGNGTDIIDDRTCRIQTAVNGGVLVFDTTMTEPAKYYDSRGVLREFVPLSNLEAYKPR